MNISVTNWECKLLKFAHEALESLNNELQTIIHNQPVLNAAYRYCTELTRVHSRTFFMASALLPHQKRQATRALYAFCRVSDDLVDREIKASALQLRDWRHRMLVKQPSEGDVIALAWSHARQQFRIPWRYAEQLVEGVERDYRQTRYNNFEDLTTYCYGVACTVGLMSMHIVGYSSPEAIPYAIRLGVALQLTNILRDVGEDYRNGRIYLPQDEMKAYGISEEQIREGLVDERWKDFMRFQIERTRKLYAEALPGVALLDNDGRFAITAAAELYRAILDGIEANDYDVFRRRASLSKMDKIRRLPGIWWRSTRTSL